MNHTERSKVAVTSPDFGLVDAICEELLDRMSSNVNVHSVMDKLITVWLSQVKGQALTLNPQISHKCLGISFHNWFN